MKLLEQHSSVADTTIRSTSTLESGNAVPAAVSGKSGWLGKAIGLILLGFAFLAGWLAANARHEHDQKEHLPSESTREARPSSAVTVTIEPVTRRTVQRSVEALGTLHAFEEVVISARVEGRVQKLLHDAADQVKPGDLLLEIDPVDYELSVQHADRELQVELAKLGLKEAPQAKLDLTKIPIVAKAQAMMDHAKSRHERFIQLAAKKTVSAEDAESAANDYRTSLAEYEHQTIQAEAGLATIQLKQVDLLVARESLAHTKVCAPSPTATFSGEDPVTYVVAQRSVSEGTLVRPGTELFRIVIGQMLKLRVPVPERYSGEIQRNQSVQVFTAASPKPFAGLVTRIYPTVDTATRTFQVEIQIPNPTGILKPGSFAKASILTNVDSDAVTVPLAALVQFAGITKIFLIDNDRAKEVLVTLGTQTTDWVEITSPVLPAGAKVITSGQTVIANDSFVFFHSPESSGDDKMSAERSKVDGERKDRGTSE